MKNSNIQLGRRLKHCRLQAQLGQREAAARIWPTLNPSSAQTKVSHHELGRHRPDNVDLRRYAVAYGVPVGQLDPNALLVQTDDSLPIRDWAFVSGSKRKPKPRRRLKILWPSSLSADAYVLPITNDNYAPVMMRGHYIVVDPNARPQHGGMIVATYKDMPAMICHVIKKNGGFIFRPVGTGASAEFSSRDRHTQLHGTITEQVISRR